MSRILTLIILFSSLHLTSAWAEAEADCENQMIAFLQSKDASFAKKYFNAQAKLTLHRLAWAYLSQVTSAEKALGKDRRGLENVIDGAIRDLDAQRIAQSEEFKKTRQAFLENTFSRRSLRDVFDTLRPVLESQQGDPSPYHLELEDLSMIAMIADINGGTAFSSNLKSSSSVINPLKLISSAYANKSLDELKGDLIVLDRELKILQKKMKSYDGILQEAAQASQACSTAARQCDDCPKSATASFSKIKLMDLLKNELRANQYAGIRYGEIWLRTRYEHRSPTPIQAETSERAHTPPSDQPASSNASSSTPLPSAPATPVRYVMQYDKNFGFKMDSKNLKKSIEEYEHAIPEKQRSRKLHENLSQTIKDLTQTSSCLVNRGKLDRKSIESIQKRVMAELYQQYPNGHDPLENDLKDWSTELRTPAIPTSLVHPACTEILGTEYMAKTRPIIRLMLTLSRDDIELKQRCENKISRDNRTALAVLKERKTAPQITDAQWKKLLQDCDSRPWEKELRNRDKYLSIFTIKER